MIATAHALVAGAIAAATTTNPVLGLTLSAASHPLLDAIPHWDFGVNWRKKSKIKLFLECLGDLTLGVVLTYLLFSAKVNNNWYLVATFLVAQWDFAEAPYWFFGWKVPFKWVYQVQSRMQNRAPLPWGIVTQIVVVLICLKILAVI
jgi:hypothetical protein